MDLVKEIHNHLKEDISKMNSLIIEKLSADEELIKIIGNYLSNSGGKRIRPVLTILSTRIFSHNDEVKENSIKLAAAVEFIHMATLLHDDVVDGSKMRRFLPSANVIWGSKASILVGDFLFSQSFKLIVDTKLLDALVVLSNTSSIIAEGEVSQLVKLEKQQMISKEEYYQIITAKTAELFGAACHVGAIVANNNSHGQLMKKFGIYLGKIFQIVDDNLDYFGEKSKTGKNIGDDFYEGKVTLPLIFLYDVMSNSEKKQLCDLIQNTKRTEDDFIWVKDLIEKYNILSMINLEIQSFADEAIKVLDEIKIDNQDAKYMKQLIGFAVSRSY